jgi:AraC-like DNA-binding protein
VQSRERTGLCIHEFTTCLRLERALVALRERTKIEAIASELVYRSTQSF